MPAGDKEYRLKVKVEGLEALDGLANKIAKQIEAGIRSANIVQMISKTGGTPVEKGLGAALMVPFSGLINRLTGGLAMGGTGKAAGAAAEGGLGMAGGPLIGILTTMAGALEALAPIQAVLKVIGTIMSLVMLPLAMILMAILMPFLLPILQVLGKLNWQAFFKWTQTISTVIANAIPVIEQVIEDVFTAIGNGGAALITTVENGVQAFIDIGEWFANVFLPAAGGALTSLVNWFANSGEAFVADLEAIWTWFQNSGEQFVNDIESLWGWFQSSGIAFVNDIESLWGWFQSSGEQFVNVLEQIWSWFLNSGIEFVNVIEQIWGWFQNSGEQFVAIIGAVWTWFQSSGEQFVNDIEQIWGWFSTGAGAGFVSDIGQIWSWFQSSGEQFVSDIEGVYNWFTGTAGRLLINGIMGILTWFLGTGEELLSLIAGGIGWLVQNAQNIGNVNWWVSGLKEIVNSILPPGLQLASGGAVVQEGLAFIHAGETVLPKGTVGIAGAVNTSAALSSKQSPGAALNVTVNVTGNQITKDTDINMLANKIATAMENRVRRLRTW
jgi:hypothetical protein